MNKQLSMTALLMAAIFVTGCSQQQVAGGSQQQVEGGSQVSGSQQQVESVAVAEPIAAPKEAAPVVAPKPAPKPVTNPWNHYHPEAPACALTKSHSHKFAKTGAPHRHNYGCLKAMAPKKPEVDVRALQLKLQAKGYYKGPIDGVVGPSTRSALERFMKR